MDAVQQVLAWFSGDKLDPHKMMSVGSVLVASVSAYFSWRTARRQERREAISLKLAHDTDVIRWSDEVISLLAETHETLCEKGVAFADAEFRHRRMHARARLSALIDRGRLFFPNRKDGDKGADKEVGFQGSRQPALDALVEAYDLMRGAGEQPGPDRDTAHDLNAIRRRFVAEVFKAVDPVRRGTTLKELQA